jgi:hypothetical protein
VGHTRLLSAFSPDTTANKLLRLDWIEALQTPGCALCHMGQRKSQRYVETLLNEAVTDVDQRDTWREARGLCHWHAWIATETPHSAGSVAILYADVLHCDLEHLAALTAAVPTTRRWLSQRSLAQRLQGLLRADYTMLRADTCEMTHFHASKRSKNAVCITSPHMLQYQDNREGLRTFPRNRPCRRGLHPTA